MIWLDEYLGDADNDIEYDNVDNDCLCFGIEVDEDED